VSLRRWTTPRRGRDLAHGKSSRPDHFNTLVLFDLRASRDRVAFVGAPSLNGKLRATGVRGVEKEVF